MFDFPDPLGPTITAPGRLQARAVRERLEALERDRLEVHLANPFPAEVGAARAPACSASFLLRPNAAELVSVDRRGDLEGPVMGRPHLVGHRVLGDLAPPGQLLLEGGLRILGMLERKSTCSRNASTTASAVRSKPKAG